MLSGHVEGQLLKFLVGMTGAKRILEIGLFTGYSALAMAEDLPDDGNLVACELDAHAARFARTWFDRSPHGRKIRVDVGLALDTLERMRASGERFDFVFIDADKPRYVDYFDLIVGSSLLDSGGLICVDNTMMQGDSYRDAPRSPNGRAIADFNRHVARDPDAPRRRRPDARSPADRRHGRDARFASPRGSPTSRRSIRSSRTSRQFWHPCVFRNEGSSPPTFRRVRRERCRRRRPVHGVRRSRIPVSRAFRRSR